MPVHSRSLLLAAAVLAGLLIGCGYVGDPMPPALKMPLPVGDLSCIERGQELFIQFSVSMMTTEGLVLKEYGTVDLRIGSAGVQPFDRGRWEAGADPIDVQPPVEAGTVRVELPVDKWVGRDVVLSVRLSNPNGRWSEWSEPFHLSIVEPVPAPSGLTVESVAAGVMLKWDGAKGDQVRHRIFRRTGENDGPELRGESEESEWLDTYTAYDTSYEYRVQSLATAGERAAESELSEKVTITPVDRFPPAVPTGLRAVAGLDSIEITWDHGPDSDLGSYRVYRRLEGEQDHRVGDALTTTSYSDRDVATGQRYLYAVTAVDQLGNESEQSAPAEQTAP